MHTLLPLEGTEKGERERERERERESEVAVARSKHELDGLLSTKAERTPIRNAQRNKWEHDTKAHS